MRVRSDARVLPVLVLLAVGLVGCGGTPDNRPVTLGSLARGGINNYLVIVR